jgi:Putative addiction module component
MTTAVADLLKAALALSPDEQRELLDALVDHLPDEIIPDLDPAVVAEIHRRSGPAGSGSAEFYTWNEVRDKLLKELDEKDRSRR